MKRVGTGGAEVRSGRIDREERTRPVGDPHVADTRPGPLDGDAGSDSRWRGPPTAGAAGRVGIAAWTFIGLVVAVAIVVLLLAAIAEVVIPVALAALLAVVLKPAADHLIRRGARPAIAAGVVVLALGGLLGGLVAASVAGLTSQADAIESAVDDAVRAIAEESGIDTETVQEVRATVDRSAALVLLGSVTALVSGVDALIGLASGVLLGVLVFYYLVKDGALLRERFVQVVPPPHREGLDTFLGNAFATLRSYGRGRTVMSAIVTAVIGLAAIILGLPLIPSILLLTFIGGYIPYIGAFLAGAYVALIALGESGVAAAIVMILVSLAANLVLENFVEPRVMSRSVDLHPMMVLVVLALGGLLGGIVGLLVAVPAAAVARSAFLQLRSSGLVDEVAAQARPVGAGLLRTDE
jgi:predicted PurR-regulated permease PerM